MKPSDFIARIAPAAMEDFKSSRVFPSLTIAQGILESNWGESGLTREGNNLFGIKGTGDAGYGMYKTKEFYGGDYHDVQAKFAHYTSWLSSIKAHSMLLQKSRYKAVIASKDWKEAVKAVYVAGYATDPKYPQKLQSLIETYDLYQYDEGVEEVDKISGKVMGKKIEAILIDGVTYIPAREVSEELGFVVKYDTKTHTFDISKK